MKIIRNTFTYTLDKEFTLGKILSWSRQFNPSLLLNSNPAEQLQNDTYWSFDILLAAGGDQTLNETEDLFSTLKKFHSENEDWLFGYISYDIKNQIEKLHSKNYDGIQAPESFFFCPRYVFEFKGKELKVHYLSEKDTEAGIRSMIDELLLQEPPLNSIKQNIQIKPRIEKESYIDKINSIKKNIHRGDIYEMNFCQEFYAENVTIDASSVYNDLNNLSPMPFSAFLAIENIFLICASPERFLAKRGNKIISEPIKGTVKRGSNEKEDKLLAESLRNDPKEQSENVMIVDLVRNDLSRTAAKGSVVVEELFGIKTFRQLHQLVSTVTSELKTNVHFTEAIKNAFPMGSMTGAPKIRAMELIEEYESTKRGIFSGTVGYITPEGDFDFNVVIRSILYNSDNHYLSFMAGSAITDGSDPVKEYEECMLKAEAMKKVLESA